MDKDVASVLVEDKPCWHRGKGRFWATKDQRLGSGGASLIRKRMLFGRSHLKYNLTVVWDLDSLFFFLSLSLILNPLEIRMDGRIGPFC